MPTPLGDQMEKLQNENEYYDKCDRTKSRETKGPFTFPPQAQILVNFEDGWSPRPFTEYQRECMIFQGKHPGRNGPDIDIASNLLALSARNKELTEENMKVKRENQELARGREEATNKLTAVTNKLKLAKEALSMDDEI